MISKMEINGIHTTVNEPLKNYINKKIGNMDRFIPKKVRESAHVEVKIKEEHIKTKKHCTCEVILHLPHETIRIAETTINMFAAVDIVETKLKNQLKRYKEKHAVKRLHHRLLNKLRSRGV